MAEEEDVKKIKKSNQPTIEKGGIPVIKNESPSVKKVNSSLEKKSNGGIFEKRNDDVSYEKNWNNKFINKKNIIIASIIALLVLGSASYFIFNKSPSEEEFSGKSLELVFGETTCVQINGENFINIVLKNNLEKSFEMKNLSNFSIDGINVKNLLSGSLASGQKKLILSYDCSLSDIGFCEGGSHFIEFGLINSTMEVQVNCMSIGAGGFCGDGFVDDGEECDDENFNDGDGCSASCELEAGQFCGDLVCDTSENCSTCPEDCGVCNLNWDISLGAEEIVFDYDVDRCELEDLVDLSVSAVRTSNGIVFSSGNDPKSYFHFGPDFNNLERDCDTPVHTSGDDWEADSFHNREWISKIYSEDGNTIYGLVHNEYHDPYFTSCKPGDTSSANRCWYNSISLAKSIDGGRTFSHLSPPNHVFVFPFLKWNPQSGPEANRFIPGPYGYFAPSNIVKKDNYYYSIIFAITSPIPSSSARGICLIRTDNLDNPLSWRYWDGIGFNGIFKNPYLDDSGEECRFISKNNINDLHGALVYNTYLQKYLLVGAGVFEHQGNPNVCGFWMSSSVDLINWDKPKLIKEGPLSYPPCNSLGYNYKADIYPSIIDHDDTTTSYEKSDRNSYLYFVRWYDGLNRDLVRVPLTINII